MINISKEDECYGGSHMIEGAVNYLDDECNKKCRLNRFENCGKTNGNDEGGKKLNVYKLEEGKGEWIKVPLE